MNWTELHVDVDGVDIHVRRGGFDGGPAVVLVHGFSDDGGCWSRFAELIADRFDVIAVDARNHGRSGRGPGGPEVLADDLAAVIRCLDLDRPILVGHSIGATTVVMVAAAHPELAGRVVLEDPPWRIDRPRDDTTRLAAVSEWIESLGTRTMDELRAVGRGQHPMWPEEEFDSWAPAKLGLGPRAVEHLGAIDWESVAADVTAPLLVVLGDDDLDAIATPELADRICAVNPTATVRRVDGAGHNIRRENLGGFAAAVTPFLDAAIGG